MTLTRSFPNGAPAANYESSRSAFYEASRVRFVHIPAGAREADFHNPPGRLLVIWLDGEVEFETSDGETRRVSAGNAVLVEDTHGDWVVDCTNYHRGPQRSHMGGQPNDRRSRVSYQPAPGLNVSYEVCHVCIAPLTVTFDMSVSGPFADMGKGRPRCRLPATKPTLAAVRLRCQHLTKFATQSRKPPMQIC